MNTDPNAGCRAGELNLGWTSDCAPALGGTGGRACCCETKAPINHHSGNKPQALGSTITTAQKEACTKANGQIVCSNQCNYTTSADVNYLHGTTGLATQSELRVLVPSIRHAIAPAAKAAIIMETSKLPPGPNLGRSHTRD
jgi:hypothetical protein